MKDVRFHRIDGWEGYCRVCLDWWPLDLEFWFAQSRGGMCRACYKIADRERHRARRIADPTSGERDAAYQREYRLGYRASAASRRVSADKHREWRQRNLDKIRERDRAYHQTHRAERLAYMALYRHRKRAALVLARDSAA